MDWRPGALLYFFNPRFAIVSRWQRAEAEEDLEMIILKHPVFLLVIDLRGLAAKQRTTAA